MFIVVPRKDDVHLLAPVDFSTTASMLQYINNYEIRNMTEMPHVSPLEKKQISVMR